MKSKEGDYFDEKHYNEIVDCDCDCYQMKMEIKKYYLSLERMYFRTLTLMCSENLKEAVQKNT